MRVRMHGAEMSGGRVGERREARGGSRPAATGRDTSEEERNEFGSQRAGASQLSVYWYRVSRRRLLDRARERERERETPSSI